MPCDQTHGHEMNADHSRLTGTILTSWQELTSLSAEWNGLLESSAADSIFLRWEWIETWRALMPADIALYCIVVRNDDGALVAVFPLYFKHYRYLGMLDVRILCPLADSNCGSEYPDIIVDERYGLRAYRAIFETLSNANARWDIIWMPRRADWSGESTANIALACKQSAFEIRTQDHIFSHIHLPESFDTFMKQMSRKRRQHRKSNCKKVFAERGAKYVACSREEEIAPFLDALFELHEKRWLPKGHRGCFAKYPTMGAFYRRFAPIAFRNGWLSMSAIMQDGAFKAVQIGYIYNDVHYALQEGFDTDYVSGVGEALRLEHIKTLISSGISTYDFLGEQTEHKRSWAAEQRKGNDVVIYNHPSSKLKAYILGQWPAIRYLSRKLKNNDALCCNPLGTV